MMLRFHALLLLLHAAAPDALEQARQQLRLQQPVPALATLRKAGLDAPRSGVGSGILAMAAWGAGEHALASRALELLRKDLPTAAQLPVEARLMQVCPLPCKVPVRSHADVLAAPMRVQARYLTGLLRVDKARAASFAQALLKDGSFLDEKLDRAARAEVLAAVYLALDSATEGLTVKAWEQMPMEPAVAFIVRPLVEKEMIARHGTASAAAHLEGWQAVNQNHEVVRLGTLLCKGNVVTDKGVCPALEKELGCRIAFSVGKAQRQVRKQEDGERTLQAVANGCPSLRERARFLQGRAAMAVKGAGPRAVETFQRLASEHPESSLADDGLLLAGELSARLDDETGARRLLERVVRDFPRSDMAPQAAWMLAWMDHQQGNIDGARTRMAALQRSTDEELALKARYWAARLDGDAGTPRLQSLIQDHPLSVEAALSRGRLQQRGADIPATSPVGNRAEVPLPANPSPPLSTGSALLAMGLEEDAAEYLRQALPLPGQDLAAASLLVAAGDATSASRHLRKARAQELRGIPSNATLWHLAYPTPFSDAMTEASAATGVPTTLLFALAREESAFDPRIRSLSGAVGLFQLLPATAVTEAMAQKIPLESEAALLNPTLNARLGAAYLQRTLRTGKDNAAVGLAGYNAGPGNARAWLGTAEEDLPLDAYLERIPITETRDYVHRVLQSAAVYCVLKDRRPLFLSTQARDATRF
jgi:soluble lytic murein transglycosylase-like protein